jgi:DNA repair exonuclease SbcCD ATPase subunit
MKITHLSLCDHIRLRVSRIYEIDIDTDQEIQLIIGSNGSGKSTLLHELFPFPPIKSSYGKHGYKSLSLSHNGINYRLTYDMENGHSFFKEETNLNISGTNEIQRELIKEHFGITNDIHNILKCSLPICDIAPSVRKKILMNMNPIDISLFLEKYQKVHKDVIAYGNNLDRLYARQKQLLTKKIPEEQYKDMLERKNILDNQEKILLIWITSVRSELDKYPDVNGVHNQSFGEEIQSLYKTVSQYRDIDRSTFEQLITELSVKIVMISDDIAETESNISKLVEIIDKAESEKGLLIMNDSDVNVELKNLYEKVNKFNFVEGFNPINKNTIPHVNSTLSNIMSLLVEMTYLEYKTILHDKEIQVLYQESLDLKFKLDNELMILNQAISKKERLLKIIRDYFIPDNCSKNSCELFQSYQDHQSTHKQELDNVSNIINEKTPIVEELKRCIDEKKSAYDIQIKISAILQKVLVLIRGVDFLKNIFSYEQIVDRSNQSPMGVYNDIVKYVTDSQLFHEYEDIKKRIHELEVLNASIESKKQVSVEAIEATIERRSKELSSLRSRHTNQSGSIEKISQELKVLNDFKIKKDASKDLLYRVSDLKNKTSMILSRKYLTNLINILGSKLNTVRSELLDITNICKEQELLLARLDTEIDSVISDIKPKFEKTKFVEKSLAELPVKYTKNFVNNIIEIANYFINEVWTYRLQLIPIEKDEDCSFQFPIIIKDEVPAKDISSCSEGQKAIIQLAFNLAMIIELKFNKFPIYCDEYDRTLDETHKQRLTAMLLNLEKSGIIEQLFVSIHNQLMVEQLSHTGNVIVLDPANITLPDTYNDNVKISYL